jgi:DNA-binding MarR family transcriptional regulator
MSTKISENSQKIAGQLHSAAIHLLRKLRREDADRELNGPRLSALSVAVFAGPVTLGDLAAAEQVRPPTMTRIVDALAALGYVTRSKSGKDGRSITITATALGKKLLIQCRERRIQPLARQISELGAKERTTLQEAAEILKQVIDVI